MRTSTRFHSGLVLAMLTAACADSTRPRLTPSEFVIDTAGLDAPTMTAMRKFNDGGCAVTVDSSGVTRGFLMPRKILPFEIPAIVHDSAGYGNARPIKMTVTKKGGVPVTMVCMIPGRMSKEAFLAALNAAKKWSVVYAQLGLARTLPPVEQQTLSREARAFHAFMGSAQTAAVGPQASANYSGCTTASGRASIGDDDDWLTIYIEWTHCTGDGGGYIFSYLNDPAYWMRPVVKVDVLDDKYLVEGLDSVTFTARVESVGHILNSWWDWRPASGHSWDPWTNSSPACNYSGATCTIPIHAGGDMYYVVEDLYGQVSSNVRVRTYLAPAVDSLGPEDDPAPAALDAGDPSYNQITAAQSITIGIDAVQQPQWTYTQGCAHCATNPSVGWREVAYDLPSHVGDCNAFVWFVVNGYLGSTWPHSAANRINTTMFDTLDATHLAKAGYVQVTDPRYGDIVTLTAVHGSGHVGFFMGWVKDGLETHPFGWANNGLPAKNNPPANKNQQNQTNKTGKFDFFAKTSAVETKFFRPVVP